MAENTQGKGKKNKGTGLVAWSPMFKQALATLRRIDIAKAEDEVGVFLPAAKLKKGLSPHSDLFAAYKAQRERLARARLPTTVEEMIKLPEGSELCESMVAFWFLHRNLSECDVLVRLPPEDKALTAFGAFLNQAMPALLAREYLGKGPAPKTPKFKVVGIGEDASGVGGHSEALKAAFAAKKPPVPA